MKTILFFAPGIPRPGGSKRAFYNRKSGRAMVVDACSKNKEWRAVVAISAKEANAKPLDGPLSLGITFYMPRPKNHFNKNGELKPNAPHWHTITPDATKLVRSTEDALTGICWYDDAQVAQQHVFKQYADPGQCCGAQIWVAQL